MPLQDELRELCTQVGPHVFEDADTFRGAFDDFVPEGAASPGDLRLLVDAISTGAFARLVAQLELKADAPTAIAAESQRLARDRGTVETEGARWALSVLAYARGLTPDVGVATRPSVLGRPPQPDATQAPSRPAPGASSVAPDDIPPTFVPPDPVPPTSVPPTSVPPTSVPPTSFTPAPAPPPGGDAPAKKRSPLPIVLAVAVVIAIAVVAGFVLLGDDDESGGGEAEVRDSASQGDSPGADTSADGGDSPYAPPPSDLPALPTGSPDTFQFIVRMPTTLHTTVPTSFGEGTGTEIFGGGDPTNPDVQAVTGPEVTATRVQALLDVGIPVRLKYYALRQVGQEGGDAAGKDLADLLADDDLMAAYWTSVRDLLTRLGGVGGSVEMVVEPDLPGELLSGVGGDATAIPTSVASSGVEGLDNLPDTFAGWGQGWLALRDELAPEVRIGLTVSPWQVGNDFLPEPPSLTDVATWADAFGDSYATFDARFDFLDTIMTYAEGGSRGPDYQPDATFFERLLAWVEGISTATDTRVVIDNVPVGNTVYRTMDDNSYHYRDAWAQWILADDTFANLVALRDAGVIGIVFGVDIDPASMTCPCDAAEDGVTNGGDSGKKSSSADDDGGYLAERLRAYTATGGLPL